MDLDQWECWTLPEWSDRWDCWTWKARRVEQRKAPPRRTSRSRPSPSHSPPDSGSAWRCRDSGQHQTWRREGSFMFSVVAWGLTTVRWCFIVWRSVLMITLLHSARDGDTVNHHLTPPATFFLQIKVRTEQKIISVILQIKRQTGGQQALETQQEVVKIKVNNHYNYTIRHRWWAEQQNAFQSVNQSWIFFIHRHYLMDCRDLWLCV